MSEEATKTYVFDSGKNTMDPSTLLAMMNNGGLGSNGGWMWVIFLFFLYGWGGNGLFGRGGAAAAGAIDRNFDTTTLL